MIDYLSFSLHRSCKDDGKLPALVLGHCGAGSCWPSPLRRATVPVRVSDCFIFILTNSGYHQASIT